MSQNLHHLFCVMQHRLGAMDRVLAALTHRGIMPTRMVSNIVSNTIGNHTVEMLVSFECADDKAIEKLVRFLQKQVYTLEARMLPADPEMADTEAAASGSTGSEKAQFTTQPVMNHSVMNEDAQRRMAHVSNA